MSSRRDAPSIPRIRRNINFLLAFEFLHNYSVRRCASGSPGRAGPITTRVSSYSAGREVESLVKGQRDKGSASLDIVTTTFDLREPAGSTCRSVYLSVRVISGETVPCDATKKNLPAGTGHAIPFVTRRRNYAARSFDRETVRRDRSVG